MHADWLKEVLTYCLTKSKCISHYTATLENYLNYFLKCIKFGLCKAIIYTIGCKTVLISKNVASQSTSYTNGKVFFNNFGKRTDPYLFFIGKQKIRQLKGTIYACELKEKNKIQGTEKRLIISCFGRSEECILLPLVCPVSPKPAFANCFSCRMCDTPQFLNL